ncbi:hypothetical protein KGG73_gp27 [Streptomyces phage Sentinel]|uniref:Uncharacterized protein n=1 Tax=Streptomyces phage Sentinel TaxID=2767584 RepID=A0A873WQB1_9CAUD|nr:hypothetical protein KGG73_gp27 [Streptomyces phage Sentinel]QPB09861.1 hypothetical protein CPT_Sentinel_027 [Streptomyces phage Sentinel]
MKVTIKYGKGHDDSWVVFEGSTQEIRTDVLDFFGMDPETQRGLSLSSIVVNATNIAHGKGLIATALGATVVEETTNEAPAKPTDDPWAAASAAQSGGPWPGSASVAEPKKEDPNAYILGEIEKQTTVHGLKKLWAANQSFFADAAVMAAWKAKGKALQAPAA